jgi:hypothetical protein
MTRSSIRFLAVTVLVASTAALAQRHPGFLQYQFNEPRGVQVSNTSGNGPSYGIVATDDWQADAPSIFGPADRGIGALGVDDTQPYENTVDTRWALNVRGSFTISWRQRMVNTPGTALGYAWGSGVSFRCFTGGVAGNRLGFRGSVLGDFYTNSSIQVGGWKTIFLVVDDSRRRAYWYIGSSLDNTLNYPTGVATFSASEGTAFKIAMHTSSANAFTRFFEMDDFRFYSRALDQIGIYEEIGNENPTGSTFDRGCAGSYGRAGIGLSGDPDISPWNHSPTTIRLTRLEPGRPGVLIFGLSAIYVGNLPLLPMDISAALRTLGCTLGVEPGIVAPFSTGSGSYSFTTYLGGQPIRSGTHLYLQALIVGRVDGYATPVLDVNLQNDT